MARHETVRQWARKFGQQFANRIRRRLPHIGDKWQNGSVEWQNDQDRRNCPAPR